MSGKRASRKGYGAAHHLVKPVDADTMVELAVKRATCQPGVSKQEGMTASADKFLIDRTGMLQEEFFSRVGAKLDLIVGMLLDDLIAKHDQIPAASLPVAAGIMLDKANSVAGRPQSLTAQLNVELGATGLSRDDVVKALTGK